MQITLPDNGLRGLCQHGQAMKGYLNATLYEFQKIFSRFSYCTSQSAISKTQKK